MIDVLFQGISSNLFFGIGIIIIVATVLAYLAKVIKQPLIVAYIVAGVILGPIGLNLVNNSDAIVALSEIGIAFLLFIVGLEMNLKKLLRVGLASVVVGLVQVVVTFFLGYYIAIWLGFQEFAVFIGLILAFSSTMVVVKLLSDKEEIDTLHGRLILGILLLQDIVAVIVLALLPHINNGFSVNIVSLAIIKTVVLFGLAAFCGKFVWPGLFRFAAKSQELLFLVGLSVLFLFSLFAFTLDLSIIIGAFIAGVSLASLPYNFNLMGKVLPLRDFFATIFFVSLGMQLVFVGVKELLNPLFILLIAVIFLKPLIILIFISLFGYGKRTSFFTANSLGQISEFSLILVTLAFYTLGSVSEGIFTLTVLLAVVSMIVASYVIDYQGTIYGLLSRPLSLFDKLGWRKEKLEYFTKGKKKSVILFGCHRMGYVFLRTFNKLHKEVLVVDYNPEVINKLMKDKVSCMYGDVSNREVLKKIKFNNAKIVVSTVRRVEDNTLLIKYVKKNNPKTLVFVTAEHLHEALDLYEAGADYVILPHILSGERISSLIKRILKKKVELISLRNKHIKHLLHLDFKGKH